MVIAMNRSSESTYFLANKILLFLLILILIYPIVIKCLNINVQCEYKKEFGSNCRSCGLTRGLIQCYSLNFKEALNFNTQSVFVFLNLIFQFLFRISIIVFFKRKWKSLAVFDFSFIFIILAINLMLY